MNLFYSDRLLLVFISQSLLRFWIIHRLWFHVCIFVPLHYCWLSHSDLHSVWALMVLLFYINIILYDILWYDVVSYDISSYDIVQYDIIWYDVICYYLKNDIISHGIIPLDAIAYDIIFCFKLLRRVLGLSVFNF